MAYVILKIKVVVTFFIVSLELQIRTTCSSCFFNNDKWPINFNDVASMGQVLTICLGMVRYWTIPRKIEEGL